ncbi:hypothetical protein Ocin01_18042 [Orchesella cincta]|uniref:Uncharacterized protein n=1 Tax=Orchesella cincta TaxID=48709 RepID=A0A1D2M6U6_ORCCI|nr:hypothetical protein Ocin01_18042 [Orchesella cincta]
MVMEILNFVPISTILLISHLLFWNCEGANVMIYTHENFTGSVYALESTPICKNLPTDFKGSIKTTGCIAVYQRTNCSGRSFVVRSDKNELRELTDGVEPQDYPVQLSFRECTDLEYGLGARLDLEWILYRDSEKMELETHGGITCECIWLTWRNYHGFFANTHGNCFKVYNNADCKGNPVSEVNGHSEDIPDGGEDGGSMQLCAICLHILYRNRVKYETDRKQPQTVSGDNTQTEDKKLCDNLKNSMATVLPASKELVKGLANTFKDETGIENVRKSYEISRKKEFQVHKKVVVPKCTNYSVSSFIESLVYPQTRFNVQLKITGTNRQSNAPLTSSDTRKGLEIKDEMEMRILDTHVQADNFTVVVESTFKKF